MFFGFKRFLKSKIRELVEAIERDHDMSWENEMYAAKTLETYVNLYRKEKKKDED